MPGYLNDEQKAKFEEMLKAAPNGAPSGSPSDSGSAPAPDSPEAGLNNAPVDSGAPMPGGAGGAPVAAPSADPTASLLAELGVSSVEELVERYRERDGKAAEYKDMLAQMLAYQQAIDNQQELEPSDPMNSIKKAIRDEMSPLFEKLQSDARNKVIQEAWDKDAREMPDIAEVMPEITQFITEHPELAVANDGLRRAYEGVRSSKYKTEAQMLDDSEFIERMANNKKIKEAVLKNHLGEIARNGDGTPVSIGGGGGTPLTGQKSAPNSMDQAKSGLAKMLGLK